MTLLIKETFEDITYLSEDILDEEGNAKGKNYFIEGIIMQGGIKNKNGRVYPVETLQRETNRYNENYVLKNRAYGELGHPQGPTINLDRVSHLFTELREDGSNIVGKAKVMDTPMGKIVKNLIDEGAQLGISSRGMGSLKQNKNGIMEVQGDFMLATAGDIVADPSAPDAFVNGIMEGVEFYYDVASGSWQKMSAAAAVVAEEAFEATVQEIKETAKRSKRELEEQASAMFKKFINSLASK